MTRIAIIAAFLLAVAVTRGAAEPTEGAPYRPRASTHAGTPRALNIAHAPGASVVRVPIEGTVDLGLSAFVSRALAQDGAAAVLLDLNTLGGRVDAAIKIRDALLASPVKTIAYVHPRAISAGALIALACDVIVVAPGASFGAATPVQLGAEGAEAVSEKMVSYFRAELRTTAEAKGRRGDIAEAMVDASVVIDGLDGPDKLLTLDTEGALSTGMADARAGTVQEALATLGLGDARELPMEENWAERLVRFVTDPVVTGLLMSLGSLGILIELYTPGLGLPGALGVTCLGLFFFGHLLVKLAGLEELLLLGAGVGLLAIEMFVIPGFGVAGVVGLVCVVASLALTLVGLPLDVLVRTGAWVEPLERVALALVLTVIGGAVALRYLPRTRAMRWMVLDQKLSSNVRHDGPASFVAADETPLVGQRGVAESDLRPVGVARFGARRVDVVSEGSYVRAGTSVRVCEVEGGRIVVRAEESAAAEPV
ncbi:MAG: NfeD family protein [Polyangiales bacterium]